MSNVLGYYPNRCQGGIVLWHLQEVVPMAKTIKTLETIIKEINYIPDFCLRVEDKRLIITIFFGTAVELIAKTRFKISVAALLLGVGGLESVWIQIGEQSPISPKDVRKIIVKDLEGFKYRFKVNNCVSGKNRFRISRDLIKK